MNNIEELILQLSEDLKRYREHLAAGKEPVNMTLQLFPEGDGLKWTIKTYWPAELTDAAALIEFCAYIKDQITLSIQPPGL